MEKMKRLSKIVILLAYFISNSLYVCNGHPGDTQPRIVIVGAGAAGIAAASKLFENGFKNVVILEAENRTGGRIHTTPFGEYLVDLGAQWVHGEIGNVVYKLANPLGLLDRREESNIFIEQNILDSSGSVLNEGIVNNLTDFYVQYMEEHNLNSDTSYESVGQYMRQMFHEEFKNIPQILNRHNNYLHLLELFVTSNDPAESWNQLSAAGMEEYVVCPGIQHINWKTRGFSTILDILMKRYPNPKEELPVLNNTILNAEVVSINYMKNSKKYPILVTTSGGQEYEADHVLVTVSLGVLKEKHTFLFTPPLPKSKVAAIEGLALGNAAKVYLYFEKPFWQVEFEVQNLFSFVWNDADRELIENSERMWLLGIMGAFTVEYKPNLLELWISAKYAKAMEELPEQKVFNHSIEVLYKFMGKLFNVTKPVAMLRTQWISNPHFRGTYSYRSVETQKKKVYPDMLEEPLQNLEILFAGEATSQHRFSTVDGAIASGWKAADRILDFYKL